MHMHCSTSLYLAMQVFARCFTNFNNDAKKKGNKRIYTKIQKNPCHPRLAVYLQQPTRIICVLSQDAK